MKTVTNKEKLTEAKFYVSSHLLELIDTAAASRFQRRSDFIRQCVGKEILIDIAESIFGDGYYFNEQDCRWYCFDKCLKRGRRIFSCELDCKITTVIGELQLHKSNIFDIEFLALAGMRIIRDKIKSLSADKDLKNYWRTGDNTKTVIVFENAELELETKNVKEDSKYQYHLPWEPPLKVEYRPELGTSCPLFQESISYLSGRNKIAADVLEAFSFLTLTGRGTAHKPILILHSPYKASGDSTYISFLYSLIGGIKFMHLNLELLENYFQYNRAYDTYVIASEEENMKPSNSSPLKKIASSNCEGPSKAMVLLSIRDFDNLPDDNYISNKSTIIKCSPIPKEKQIMGYVNDLQKEGSQVVNYLLEKFDYSQNIAIDILDAAAARINF